MYSRTAYLIGSVAEGDRRQFDGALRNEIVPLIRTMPGVSDAKVHFSEYIEDGAPAIYASLAILFASESEMQKALQSAERLVMQEKFRKILPAFHGKIFHINGSVS